MLGDLAQLSFLAARPATATYGMDTTVPIGLRRQPNFDSNALGRRRRPRRTWISGAHQKFHQTQIRFCLLIRRMQGGHRKGIALLVVLHCQHGGVLVRLEVHLDGIVAAQRNRGSRLRIVVIPSTARQHDGRSHCANEQA